MALLSAGVQLERAVFNVAVHLLPLGMERTQTNTLAGLGGDPRFIGVEGTKGGGGCPAPPFAADLGVVGDL